MKFPEYISDEEIYTFVREFFVSGGEIAMWDEPPGKGGIAPTKYSEARTLGLYIDGGLTGHRYGREQNGWRVHTEALRSRPPQERFIDPEFFRGIS